MAESEAEAQPNNPPAPPASHSPLSLSPGAVENMDGRRADLPIQEVAQTPVSQAAAADGIERNARVDAVWQQMNKGISAKTLKSISTKQSSVSKKPPGKNPQHKSSTGWMTYLGLGSNKTASPGQGMLEKHPSIGQNGVVSEDAKEIAAAALSAVKDAAAAAAAATGKGKIEIKEVRDFAGEEIEVKKLVDAASKEGKAGPASAVDAVLEQIKKKPKLSVLDKTKKDWGEFKGENQGMEEELDAYKKSSNQYLDRVSFLQRADYREFERERDARLALQSKRKTADMREDD